MFELLSFIFCIFFYFLQSQKEKSQEERIWQQNTKLKTEIYISIWMENGSIDNTKKMVLEGLSEALHVSVEWLKGETDEYETDITDKRELQIRDAMGDILEQLPLALTKEEDAFSKDLLLLMLKQYGLFLDSFQFACKNFKGNDGQTDIAKTIGFESNDEYNEIMFLREITHTINAFNEMADIVRLYSKKPKTAEQRLANLLSEVLYEDSESV